MKTIGVLTSGGDAPGMNAAIRAVVRASIYNKIKVYGIRRGYEGLLEGDIEEMEVSSVSDIIQRGGTVLRTARSEEFMEPQGFHRALDMLENFEIRGLVVIGGDGSLKGGLELSGAGIKVMGIPGTIDNDLAFFETGRFFVVHRIYLCKVMCKRPANGSFKRDHCYLHVYPASVSGLHSLQHPYTTSCLPSTVIPSGTSTRGSR